MSTASDQITEYLSVGGLFNPDIMNRTQHEAVRDTLIKARDDIHQLERGKERLRDERNELRKKLFKTEDENAALRELVARMAAEMREVDHEFCSLVDYDNLQNKI